MLVFLIFAKNSFSQNDSLNLSPYNYSFKELSEIKVTTGSLKDENTLSAPTNVIIITHKMIEERNYQILAYNTEQEQIFSINLTFDL